MEAPIYLCAGEQVEKLCRYLFTGESVLTVQMFSYSPFTSPGCPAWEWVGSGVGCHPSVPALCLGAQLSSVSHENKKTLLVVVSERKHVGTVASLAQENDAEIDPYWPWL